MLLYFGWFEHGARPQLFGKWTVIGAEGCICLDSTCTVGDLQVLLYPSGFGVDFSFQGTELAANPQFSLR